jgi:hypothetical protein
MPACTNNSTKEGMDGWMDGWMYSFEQAIRIIMMIIILLERSGTGLEREKGSEAFLVSCTI